jgi:hypothetical protein
MALILGSQPQQDSQAQTAHRWASLQPQGSFLPRPKGKTGAPLRSVTQTLKARVVSAGTGRSDISSDIPKWERRDDEIQGAATVFHVPSQALLARAKDAKNF